LSHVSLLANFLLTRPACHLNSASQPNTAPVSRTRRHPESLSRPRRGQSTAAVARRQASAQSQCDPSHPRRERRGGRGLCRTTPSHQPINDHHWPGDGKQFMGKGSAS
jgi:hypothetical protein